MHRRPVAVLVVVAFVSAAFAGCLARSASPDEATAEDTANSVQHVAADAAPNAATSAARDWHADAFLVAAFATEGFHADMEDPPFLYDSRDDPTVGDGLARVWTYAFAAPNETNLFFAAIEDGERVTYARKVPGTSHGYWFPAGDSSRSALPQDVIASDAAAAAVAARPEAVEFVDAHPVSAARLVLTVDYEGRAIWMVARHTSGGFGMSALVDAVTGDVIDVHRYPDDLVACPVEAGGDGAYDGCTYPDPPTPPPTPPTPPSETYSRTVTVDTFNPWAFFEFEARAWDFARTVTVTVDVPGTDPVDARTVTLYDSFGMRADETQGVGALVLTLEDANPPGTYYRVEIGGGVPGALPQEIRIDALVEYGEWLGDRWMDTWSGGNYVRMRQVVEESFEVHSDGTDLEFRIQFHHAIGLPALEDATYELVGPDGAVLGEGDTAGGVIGVADPAPGLYTVRVRGGEAAIAGIGYEWRSQTTYTHTYW